MKDNTTFNKVTITPYDGTDYSRLDFDGENGEPRAAIVAHGLSNVKTKVIDGVKTLVRYVHNHMTLAYTTDSNGKLLGRIDIPLERDHTQIQIENADLVFKGDGCAPILRSAGGKFYKVHVSEVGELTTARVPHDQIIWANKEYITE